MNQLETTSLMKIASTTGDKNARTFVIEPLAPGFGLTLGNSLRRVLLSSLGGAAVTSIRAEGASHEFSTIPGIGQDMVDIILNLKKLRFKLDDNEAKTAVIDVKGAKKITGADIKCPTGLAVVNTGEFIAESLSNGRLLLEMTVEQGTGYSPTELRKDEKLPIGVIAIDAAFSPVRRVNFSVENTRVGNMTNFDKLNLEIVTDHSITAEAALIESARILVGHFEQVVALCTEKPSKSAPTQDDGVTEKPKKTLKEKSLEINEEQPAKKTKATKKSEPTPKE